MFRLVTSAFVLLMLPATAWCEGTAKIEVLFERLHEEANTSAADEAITSNEAAATDAEPGTEGSKLELATFGNGCFWCTEAIFEELYGVKEVVSGYSGGRVANPTYRQVCTGLTGHAEVIHLRFDPAKISYGKLLEVFWRTHDPTTLNQQGPDRGTQYRSAVFYHNAEQKRLAERYKEVLNSEHAFRKPIVTEITKFTKFFPAEKYHQDYFELNGRAPYCRQMIRPKLTKFRRAFKDELERNPKNQVESSKG